MNRIEIDRHLAEVRKLKPFRNSDESISYWSLYRQRWERAAIIPESELLAMPTAWCKKVELPEVLE
ncbi:MAG: hypothetical protein QM278_04105 [Pseudomonadota bacterium]|nr:hypothetical protein [Pseudomonadota bacterium]